MKKRRLQYSSLLLSLLVLFLLGGCGSSGSGQPESTTAAGSETAYADDYAEQVIERGYLLVGCKTDVPDLSYYDEETKTWSGLEVELAYKTAALLFGTDAQSAKDEGLVHFVGVTVDDREETLESGDIDCMLATYTDTKEREKKFALSDSYYTDYIGIMVRTSGENPNSVGSGEIKSLANLDGKYIGVAAKATTREDMLDYINTMNQIKVSPLFFEYASYEKMFRALKDGDIDAMAVDVSILNGYVDGSTKILNDRFAGQHYAAAVQKGHASLLTYINEAIAE